MRCAPWATHNAACTVALELDKADAPRPKRRLSSHRLPVGGAAARTHRLRAPYPRKRLLPADWPCERNVPRASNARRTRLKAPRTHRRTSGDTGPGTRGEPYYPRRRIAASRSQVNPKLSARYAGASFRQLIASPGGLTFTPILTHIPPAWTSGEIPASWREA